MRKLLFILLCFVSVNVSGKSYYVSLAGSDANTGLSPASPWKTIAKVNSFAYSSGDSILFRGIDTFYGAIISPRNNLFFSSYGGGTATISGYTLCDKWTSVGGGVYTFTVPRLTQNPLNLVSINGVPQQVARFPNVDSFSTNSVDSGYFSCNPVSPTDTTQFVIINTAYRPAVNDELILRTQKWRAVKIRVTSVVGAVVHFVRTPGLTAGGSNKLEPPDDGSGWFCQRKINYLDEFGEWFLNPATRVLSVFFGSANPLSYTVKVSTIDSVCNLAARSFQDISNLRFIGGNTFQINSVSGANITVKSCEFMEGGCKGIGVVSAQNVVLTNNYAINHLENGITSYSNSRDNNTVTNNTVINSGRLIGMGSFNHPEDYTGMATFVRNNLLVQENNVIGSGVDGIFWQCQNNGLIQHNVIDTFCTVLQDHGGIYTYTEAQTSATPPVPINYTNRVIKENFISNGIGASAGAGGSGLMASGIYNDGATMNILEQGNTIFNLPRSGITSNDPLGIVARDNNIFNTVRTFTVVKGQRRDSINENILNNVGYQFANSVGGSQTNIYQVYYEDQILGSRTALQSVARAGTWDSNYYSIGYLPKWTIVTYNPGSTTNRTFVNWQTATGKDMNSDTLQSLLINSPNLIFLRNPSNSNYNYTLNGNYLSGRKVPLSGNQILPPWGSIILLKVSETIPGIKARWRKGN